MDNAIGHLMSGLSKRNLQNHVHLIVVSDHGMAQADKSARLIFYDKILSADSESFLRKREAWPLFGLRPKDDAPDYALDQIYNELYQYAQQNDAHYSVYRREDMPARFHYNSTERIAPIVMVPDVGYAIIRSTDIKSSTGQASIPQGIHGYDNMASEMRAIFAARGPQIEKRYVPGTVVSPFFNVEMYRFLTALLQLDPAPNNATLDGVFVKKET
jgi:predicted AlkP superfamily pyrophosphatase or phosphodiesterase